MRRIAPSDLASKHCIQSHARLLRILTTVARVRSTQHSHCQHRIFPSPRPSISLRLLKSESQVALANGASKACVSITECQVPFLIFLCPLERGQKPSVMRSLPSNLFPLSQPPLHQSPSASIFISTTIHHGFSDRAQSI